MSFGRKINVNPTVLVAVFCRYSVSSFRMFGDNFSRLVCIELFFFEEIKNDAFCSEKGPYCCYYSNIRQLPFLYCQDKNTKKKQF